LKKSRGLKSSTKEGERYQTYPKNSPTYERGGKRDLDLLGGREANGLLSQGKSPKQGQRSIIDPKRPTDRGQILNEKDEVMTKPSYSQEDQPKNKNSKKPSRKQKEPRTEGILYGMREENSRELQTNSKPPV